MALALKVGIRPEDMERMSYVSFINILISTVEEKPKIRKASFNYYDPSNFNFIDNPINGYSH
jgi:hypothetical protein